MELAEVGGVTVFGATREQIGRLEAEIRQLPPADVPTEHTFGPGFYARTVTIPAGATLTGKVHATEHIFIVSRGDLTVVTEEGRHRVGAGFQMVCRAGLKRAGYAHSETVCTNIHVTAETDLAKLEADLIVPEPIEQLDREGDDHPLAVA